MNRDVLISILRRATPSEGPLEFASHPEGRLIVYAGPPGRAMALSDVSMVRLHDAFVEIVHQEKGITTFIPYDSLSAIEARSTPGEKGRRAGF